MPDSSAIELLELLCARVPLKGDSRRVLIVCAHPDDETIGCGAMLAYWSRNVTIVHTTDGSPRSGVDAQAGGFAASSDYASARRQELERAMALANVSTDQRRELACPDQQATYRMPELARTLVGILREHKPDVIVTQPYEGGHPDHDATAFAVHAACRLLARDGQAPALLEMTAYHMGPGGITPGCFLPASVEERRVELLADEKARKQAMFDCFATQRETLAYFPIGVEVFRIAPVYDFTKSPHPGQLFYEKFDWGATGEQFRHEAGLALRTLGLSEAT